MIRLQGQLTRPLQAVFNWSAKKKILTLEASVVRVNLDRDPVSGQNGRQRGRHLYECRTTSLKKHKRHERDD